MIVFTTFNPRGDLQMVKAKSVFTLLTAISLGVQTAALGKELEVGGATSEGTSLTIYNQNFGLVRDVRTLSLEKGVNFVRFSDVAAAIDPTSVSFTSLTAPNSVVVREQNYQYDVMSPDTILSKSVGKEVTFRRYLNSTVSETRGILLNPPQVTIVDTNGNPSTQSVGLVLKTDSGIILNPAGESEVKELPPGLVPKPSLLWKLETTKPGDHKSEIAYQTAGMSWKCDYVAVANDDDTKTDLTSWVTLNNESGASYKNASLKLMAGDVNRVTAPAQPMYMKAARMEMAADMAPQFSEKSFAEYHLYTLAGITDVNNHETKQMSLFNAAAVPTKKLYIFEPEMAETYGGWAPQRNTQKVNVKIEIANTKANNLGMALPKGKVRVYKKDSDGSLQFVGEDLIDHTPSDEKIRLYIGDAFDLVGERKQMNYTQISDRKFKANYEISLRNRKKEGDVTITAVEHSYGDWKINSSSHKYKKVDSHTFEFPITVPAGGEVKVQYEIETRN